MTIIVRSHKIIVQASPRAAFEYISDITRHPEWSGGQLKIEQVTPGAVTVGKEYVSHGEVAGEKERPNWIRISRYEPPHIFGFIASDPSFGDVVHEFRLREIQDSVEIERVVTFSLNPWRALALSLFIYPFIGKPSMNRSMLLLQRRLERQYALIL